jgi:hypothetical protein
MMPVNIMATNEVPIDCLWTYNSACLFPWTLWHIRFKDSNLPQQYTRAVDGPIETACGNLWVLNGHWCLNEILFP